jgi:hypothetical protein
MKNTKTIKLNNMLMLLVTLFAMTINLSSCSSKEEDEGAPLCEVFFANVIALRNLLTS